MPNPFLDSDTSAKKNPFLDTPTADAASKEPGFFSRVGTDLSNRWKEGQESAQQYNQGQINAPEMLLRSTGKVVAGSANDIIGEGIKSAVAETPDFIKKPVAKAASSIMDTSVGKAGLAALKQGTEAYKRFAAANPRAASDIESTVDIASLLGGAKPLKAVADTGAEAGSAALGKAREAVNAKSDEMAKAATMAKTTPDMIREEAHVAYDAADKIGATYSPKATNAFIKSARDLLPKSERVADLFSDEPAAILIRGLEKFENTPMSLSEAQELDQKIGAMANKHVDLKTGKLDADGEALYNLQQKLRDVVYDPKEEHLVGGKEAIDASKRGRELWAKQARLRDIDAIIERAKLTENPIPAAKNAFKNLITNKARFNRFSDEEKELIRKAAKSGMTTDLLRVFGSRLVPIAATAGGAASTGGISGGLVEGAVAHAGSTAARGLANKRYMARPNALREAVIGREVTPLPTPKPKPILQLTYQPASPEIAVGRKGAAKIVPEAEQAANNQARERLKNLGLTSDVLRAQDVKVAREMEQKYGQSELGKFVVANKNEPIMARAWEVPHTEYNQETVNRMLRDSAWNKLDKANKAKINSEIESAWNSHQVTVADMILSARKAAAELSKAKGEPMKTTSIGHALLNAVNKNEVPSSIGTSFDDFLGNQ